MFKIILINFVWIILISIINKQAIAITGKEISLKVSHWLTQEGIKGTPVFSKNTFFKDCSNEIEIKKVFQNYKTIKVNCLDKNGFDIIMRVKISEKAQLTKLLKSAIYLKIEFGIYISYLNTIKMIFMSFY